MKTLLYSILLSCSFAFPLLCNAQVSSDATQAQAMSQKLQDAGLLFTENRGQVADLKGTPRPDILFTAHSKGAKVFLTATGIHYQFARTEYPDGYEQDERKVRDYKLQESLSQQVKTSTHRFTLSLAGANPKPVVRKQEQNVYIENFYLAHCPDGIAGVHTYSRLTYEGVYPGIDWVIYSNGGGLKYDFVVHPGADPAQIRLQVSDAQDVRIDKDGGLVMSTQLGEVHEAAPVSFVDGKNVATHFVQGADKGISFSVGSYDRTKMLTIDPSVTWATYYGGSSSSDYHYGNDTGYSCTTDGSGNVYLAGTTGSATGIASGGWQLSMLDADVEHNWDDGFISPNYTDAFIVKFNGLGTRLWATYYGGGAPDNGYSCATDGSGNVYLVGRTNSKVLPVTGGGFQSGWYYNPDAFIVKFSSTGSLKWATYYAGDDWDCGMSCAVDAGNNVYLVGRSWSDGLAYRGFQNSRGGDCDGFIVKFNSAGVRLWATYFGGAGIDEATACAIDPNGNVYVVGNSNNDAYLLKLNAAGTLLWDKYFGGNDIEKAHSCAVDKSGNVYIAGDTKSRSGIASGGFQNTHGNSIVLQGWDAFLAKFNSNGVQQWATYYGGLFDDHGYSCTTDATGNVYLAGGSISTSLGFGGFKNTNSGANDAFLVKFNSAGARQWSTYYGGSADDEAYSCAIDGSGNIYMAGYTNSASGIAYGSAFKTSYSGGSDAFLVKIAQPAQQPNSSRLANAPMDNNAGSLSIYPIPNQGAFTFNVNGWTGNPDAIAQLQVIDISGRTVWHGEQVPGAVTKWSANVSLNDAVSGTYFLLVSCGQTILKQRFTLKR